MRRDKAWYARLTKRERSELYWLERDSAKSGGHSAYIPDDCSECPHCGTPHMHGGLCPLCERRLGELVKKGNGN